MNGTAKTTRHTPNKTDRPLVTLDHNPLVAYFDAEAGRPQSPKDQADAVAMRKLFAMQRLGVVRLMVTQSTALEKKRSGEEPDWQADIARLEALGLDREDIYTVPLPVALLSRDDPNTLLFNDPETGAPVSNIMNIYIHALLFEGKTEPDAVNVSYRWTVYRDQECTRRGIVGREREAVLELDSILLFGNIPVSPLSPNSQERPALDSLSPKRRQELQRILDKLQRAWFNRKNDALGLYNHVSYALHTNVPENAVFVTSDKHFKRRHRVKRNGKVVEMTVWELLKERGAPGQLLSPEEAVDYLSKVMRVEASELS